MTDIYCKLIINGRRTLEQIPDEFQEKVILRLAELGYDENGSPVKED